MGNDVEVSVSEMLGMVARARLAGGYRDRTTIMSEIKGLSWAQLVSEFHRAVATLDSKGLLNGDEQRRLHSYAQDTLSSPWPSNAA